MLGVVNGRSMRFVLRWASSAAEVVSRRKQSVTACTCPWRRGARVLFSVLGFGLTLAACSKQNSSPSEVVRPVERTISATEQQSIAKQLDRERDYAAEGKAFDSLVTAEQATEAQIRSSLGIDPDRWYRWNTDDGELRCAEYDIRGVRPSAPFFEAFAQHYDDPTFLVFYKRKGGKWVSIDGGFHNKGIIEVEHLER
jgi:hypothetical protein